MKGKIKIKSLAGSKSLEKENEILKKENELLRKQIEQYKNRVNQEKEDIGDVDDEGKVDLSMEIIDLQRNRINDLQAGK